jgi:hypothetical protein
LFLSFSSCHSGRLGFERLHGLGRCHISGTSEKLGRVCTWELGDSNGKSLRENCRPATVDKNQGGSIEE